MRHISTNTLVINDYFSVRRTLANTLINKYANRRTSLFKLNRPLRAPRRKATIRTHDSIWDIVSCISHIPKSLALSYSYGFCMLYRKMLNSVCVGIYECFLVVIGF